MSRPSVLSSWLSFDVTIDSAGRYEHALGTEINGSRIRTLPHLKHLIAKAHDDARDRLRKLVGTTLDPLGEIASWDPAEGYPEKLHITTLKGYFGEVMAGLIAETFGAFGYNDWVVPAYLFRYHLVEFQQLALIRQTGGPTNVRPGRTGDDCLAFRRNARGDIVATLMCEAKCTKDHDSHLIADAHEKSSLSNLLPVDIMQLIEILLDSPDKNAKPWVIALRKLCMGGPVPGAGYERIDQVTYVCGQKPKRGEQTSWISTGTPHAKYTGGRRLHVAEIHLSNVDKLIELIYRTK